MLLEKGGGNMMLHTYTLTRVPGITPRACDLYCRSDISEVRKARMAQGLVSAFRASSRLGLGAHRRHPACVGTHVTP